MRANILHGAVWEGAVLHNHSGNGPALNDGAVCCQLRQSGVVCCWANLEART